MTKGMTMSLTVKQLCSGARKPVYKEASDVDMCWVVLEKLGL